MNERTSAKVEGVYIPNGPEAIEPSWLTRILRKAGALTTGSVSSIGVEPLTGKGIASTLVRLRICYRDTSHSVPATMIAKFSCPSELRDVMRSLRTYEREVRFYREIADGVAVRTPRCYYSAFDTETADHILLLEEITGARAGDMFAGCSAEDAELAIRTIAEFHARWWESDDLEEMEWLVVPHLQQTYQETYREYWGSFVERADGVLSAEMRAIGDALCDRYQEVTAPLFDPPCTMLHRDYQLDNLFFDLGGEPGTLAVFDWQWVTKGRGAYDVAFFAALNLDPSTRRATEIELLHGYQKVLEGSGVKNYTFAQVFNDYRRGIIATFAQVAQVTGLGLFDDKLELVIETMIRRVVSAVLDLKCGELV